MSCGYLWFRPRASPGFDGWIMLVHEEFETEDQAIYCEKKRLSSIGGVKSEALRAAGVKDELIGLDVDCGIIYNPPDDGDERFDLVAGSQSARSVVRAPQSFASRP